MSETGKEIAVKKEVLGRNTWRLQESCLGSERWSWRGRFLAAIVKTTLLGCLSFNLRYAVHQRSEVRGGRQKTESRRMKARRPNEQLEVLRTMCKTIFKKHELI